ncbi:MAG: (2Fe-2S)-binding protein [Sphingobacteriales bacterium]|nr:MAG: (2Fe-2S)-binding protein [Sphingobacteriales bacterium]
MTSLFNLQVNGKTQRVEADPSTPLLYILRNELGLNGPKFGCGLQQCGACMVLLDGAATPSCGIPVSAVAKRNIQTLEGLETGSQLHPVQQAFIDEQAAQCGFCLNGMVISSVALLRKNPRPTDPQIRESLQRCLCRCGTQSRIIRAVKKASKQ